MNFVARLMFGIRRSAHRAVAIELACVTPALLLLAIVGYAWGGYLLLNHRVQSAAEEALASASAVGDPTEREKRARSVIARMLPTDLSASGRRPDLAIETRAGRLTVTVIYDASRSPIFVVRRFLALPPPTIIRMASAHLTPRDNAIAAAGPVAVAAVGHR